jgi:YHS domain-containing protein
MKINYSTVAAVLMATMTLTVPIANSHAQVQPATKATAAMTFAKAGEAWQGILADLKALGDVIRAGKLSEAHELAFSIRDAIVTLPYKSGSLAPAKKSALQKQVAVVAGIAENIDKYGDAGNAAKTKAEYAKLMKALDAIEALYPANALPTSGEKPMSAADKALFLTPGGLYTDADIAANGNTSAYLKYASIVPNHDTQVKVGEAVCPISETKPNPQLTWVIGGKTYTFCCPPCIAEFVKKAKTAPQSIKAPEAYVKK